MDRVKIDRSTSRLLKGRREEAIMGGMVLTARLLGLDLVAEGAGERESGRDCCVTSAARSCKGYRIARLMLAEHAEAWALARDPAFTRQKEWVGAKIIAELGLAPLPRGCPNIRGISGRMGVEYAT